MDSSLASAEGRRARETEIEQAIGRWMQMRTADDAMLHLQGRGIPAGVARAPYDLLRDPHLCARGFWAWIDHPFIGRHPQPVPAYRDSEVLCAVPRHPPTLGQHNQEVLNGLLGISQKEIDRLALSNVIGTKALPPSLRKARAAVGAKD